MITTFIDARTNLDRYMVRRTMRLVWRVRFRRIVEWLLRRPAGRPLPPAERMIRDPRVPASMTYDLNAIVPGSITLPGGRVVKGPLRFRDVLYIGQRSDGTNALIDDMVRQYVQNERERVAFRNLHWNRTPS